MDLRRLKTIFIIVLLIINFTMIAALRSFEKQDEDIVRAMNESVSSMLQSKMIFLAPKLDIPTSPEIYNVYLERMANNNEELVARFLRGKYTSESDGVYVNGSRKLHIGGDVLTYENSKPSEPVTDFSAKGIESACRKEMKRLGIKSDIYKFNGVNKAGDIIKAIFTARHGDASFFDAYISFDVSRDGIVSVSGKNLISDLTVSGRNVPYFNINSILLELAKNPDIDINKKNTIVSISSGYYIGQNSEEYRNILAIPVWQIATDSGDIFYYDARNGNYISEKV